MWKTIIVIVFAVAAGGAELPRLFKQSVKEAVVYGLMLAVGTTLSIAAMMSVSWPSPLVVLATIFEPINRWFAQLFR